MRRNAGSDAFIECKSKLGAVLRFSCDDYTLLFSENKTPNIASLNHKI